MRRLSATTVVSRRAIGASGIALTAVIVVTVMANRAGGGDLATASVRFDDVIATAGAANIGFTATTFGVDGGPVPRDPADLAALKALGAGSVRIQLAPDTTGQIVASAAGTATGVSADQWLTAYEQIGVEPTVIVNLDIDDALAVLNYLRSTNHPVSRFIIGNEMDANSKANVSPAEYIAQFARIAAAMRAIDPALQIGGPATAAYDGVTSELVRGLLDAPANERASFIDYHAYGAGRGQRASMQSASVYGSEIANLRATINDPTVGVEVGEFNMNWSTDPHDNSPFQTAWVANALGDILQQGATAFVYGDKSDAMGLVGDGRPKASYWGIGMFTGGGLFRHFGDTMVATTSSRANVRIYASSDPKNIVIVNSGGQTSLSLKLTGFDHGTADVWQSTNLAPQHLKDITVAGGQLATDLAANSVTTLLLNDQ